MPLLGTLDSINLSDNNTYAQNRSLPSEVASVGYFTTTLLDGVKIEITASNHSAWIRYSFPSSLPSANESAVSQDAEVVALDGSKNADDVHVLVDLTHVLPAQDPTTQSYGQKYVQGQLHVRSGSEQASYSGSATYSAGWSQAPKHEIYFCGNFSTAASPSLSPTNSYAQQVGYDGVGGAGTFSWPYDPVHPRASKPLIRSDTDIKSTLGNQMGVGALFSWTRSSLANDTRGPVALDAKIGISYVSADQACNYIAQELPNSLSFDHVVEQARQEWESKVLNVVEVVDDGSPSSSNDTLKRMLYTGLYQSALMPTDKTGEILQWNSSEAFPYYDDHYVGHPLLVIIGKH